MMCFGLKDRKRPNKTNHCVIVLLDETQLVHELQATTTGQDLLNVVFKHLNLLETSYFGLKYYTNQSGNGNQQVTNKNNNVQHQQQHQIKANTNQQQVVLSHETHWLDMNRSAIKQLKDSTPMTVYFSVKYYASDPCKLAEEITRYQFFLQCKQDILQSKLSLNFDLAIELFGLAIQSELGDFDPMRHLEGYVSEFHFIPHQSANLEQRAAHYHKQLMGQVPATAELNFLERIKWLDLYGCELHPIQYDDDGRGDHYALGLNPIGVLVLRNKLKVAQYLWSSIVRSKCQGRCFLMDVIEQPLYGGASEQTQTAAAAAAAAGRVKKNRFGFRLADKQSAKKLLWSIEEHKNFHFLINSTTETLNQQRQQLCQQIDAIQQQQQQQQQQQMKFSQRFRQSIRSAISVGAHLSGTGGQAGYYDSTIISQQQQQQKLRSSMKSQQQQQQQQQQPRSQPTVVRMPSRRYGHSSRSLPRPYSYHHQQQQQANGNGLPATMLQAPPPPVPPLPANLQSSGGFYGAATMIESQRQQALAMVQQMQRNNIRAQQQQQQHQFNLLNKAADGYGIGKSQTLRPLSSKDKRNLQYQQQLIMAASMAQQQAAAAATNNNNNNNNTSLAEISILPPGQHTIRPSIYRATSIVDGVNQLVLGGTGKPGQQCDSNDLQIRQQPSKAALMMMQQFNTAHSTIGAGQHHHQQQHPKQTRSSRGESPARSTKSALAPSRHSRDYSMREMHKQTAAAAANYQLFYNTNAGAGLPPPPANYGGDLSLDYNGALSARSSPKSTSRRLARHRSRSTGENLNLISNNGLTIGAVPPATGAHPMNQVPMSMAAMQLPIPIPISNQQYSLDDNMLLTTVTSAAANNNSGRNNQNYNNHYTGQQRTPAAAAAAAAATTMRLPPPDYNTSTPLTNSEMQDQRFGGLKNQQSKYLLSEEVSNELNRKLSRKRTSLDFQANSLVNNKNYTNDQLLPNQSRKTATTTNDNSNNDDEYYCSRSDCSSIDVEGSGCGRRLRDGQVRNQAEFKMANGGHLEDRSSKQSVCLTNGKIDINRNNKIPYENMRSSMDQQQEPMRSTTMVDEALQREWKAIEKRHRDFKNGSGLMGNLDKSLANFTSRSANSKSIDFNIANRNMDNLMPDINNNNVQATTTSIASKQMTNRQATPILLSMGHHQFDTHHLETKYNGSRKNNSGIELVSKENHNSKLVELLNQQRQQLNSSTSDTSMGLSNSSGSSKRSSDVLESPSVRDKQQNDCNPQAKYNHNDQHNEGSTTSNNSTTSGYYAASNSTGPTSVDSDAHMSAPARSIQQQIISDDLDRHRNRKDSKLDKMGFPQNSSKIATINETRNSNSKTTTTSNEACIIEPRDWSPLDQLNQFQGSSLKYVSFDV